MPAVYPDHREGLKRTDEVRGGIQVAIQDVELESREQGSEELYGLTANLIAGTEVDVREPNRAMNAHDA